MTMRRQKNKNSPSRTASTSTAKTSENVRKKNWSSWQWRGWRRRILIEKIPKRICLENKRDRAIGLLVLRIKFASDDINASCRIKSSLRIPIHRARKYRYRDASKRRDDNRRCIHIQLGEPIMNTNHPKINYYIISSGTKGSSHKRGAPECERSDRTIGESDL